MDVKFAFVLSTACLMLICGCGKTEQAPADDSDEKQAVATPDSAGLLVGIWYGRARLNQELLQQKLNSSPTAADRQTLQNIARIFQTTEIGAQFEANGSMQLDIQIQPGGQILRDSTQGTWRLLESLENAVIVETTEPLPAGGTESNKVRYQFEQGGQLAIMVAPTSELLADCQPVFVFERVEPAGTAVAERADEESFK